MNSIADQAIVLGRIDYGERDRILTLLTREHGKISVLAKSVRSQKSRLAGGVELLSISDVTFVEGKSDLKTLTGARLVGHFRNITSDMGRMQFAFDALKTISKLTEDGHGQEYFSLLAEMLRALDDAQYDARLTEVWFGVHLLRSAGTLPEIKSVGDIENYDYDFSSQRFVASDQGVYTRNDLKLLKILSTHSRPVRLKEASGSEEQLASLIKLLLKSNLTEV